MLTCFSVVNRVFLKSIGVKTNSCRLLMSGMDLSDLRKPYSSFGFDLDSLVPSHDPFDQFTAWMEEAMACKQIAEPNAMALATCSPTGQPSIRMLLMKHYDPNGFVFFTTINSQKGRELAVTPNAALLFYWEALHRQVRIEGIVDQLSDDAADAYWLRRPYNSQVSAATGLLQSSVIPNRKVLVDKIKEVCEKFPEPGPIPRPSNWGGYRLNAGSFEFWQGQTNRDHDRLKFTLDEKSDKGWKIDRLAP